MVDNTRGILAMSGAVVVFIFNLDIISVWIHRTSFVSFKLDDLIHIKNMGALIVHFLDI